MSGHRITGNYTNTSASYAQTLMSSDIAAIQHIYGANYATNAGNTVYSWTPTSGSTFVNGVAEEKTAGNTIFKTIWDGGGVDTYDLSAFKTSVSINLNPGAWTTTSTAQLANLSGNGHVLAPGNIDNAYMYNGSTKSLIENAIGGSGNDTIIGNQVANISGAVTATISLVAGPVMIVYRRRRYRRLDGRRRQRHVRFLVYRRCRRHDNRFQARNGPN